MCIYICIINICGTNYTYIYVYGYVILIVNLTCLVVELGDPSLETSHGSGQPQPLLTCNIFHKNYSSTTIGCHTCT